jgi:hypothetical protein
MNFFYLLVQIGVAVDDLSVRGATRRAWWFLRAEPRLAFGVFGVVLLLVVAATGVSIVATTSLGLIAFVPVAGLAVVPLQFLAWLFRSMVFQFLSVSALGAYLHLYGRFNAREAAGMRPDASDAVAPAKASGS